jgi:membrane-associated protein
VDSAALAFGSALTLGPSWLDPQQMLDAFGAWALWGAAAVVFAECGLLLGFFLPGDSLLFTVGLLTGTGAIHQPLWVAALVLTAAAFAGNAVGYEIGRASGPRIFTKPDSRLFKREYVDKTVAFFDRYGARAIVLARFVPIVRTFITVTAGIGQMDRARYLIYSGAGGVLWASGVTVLGQLLGKIEFVAKNIEILLIAIVLISVIPIGVEWWRRRGTERPGTERPGTERPGTERPGTERPSTERPSTERPGTERPGAGQNASRPDGPAFRDQAAPQDQAVMSNAEWTASLPVIQAEPADSPQPNSNHQPRGRTARHATDTGSRTSPSGLNLVSDEPADG